MPAKKPQAKQAGGSLVATRTASPLAAKKAPTKKELLAAKTNKQKNASTKKGDSSSLPSSDSIATTSKSSALNTKATSQKPSANDSKDKKQTTKKEVTAGNKKKSLEKSKQNVENKPGEKSVKKKQPASQQKKSQVKKTLIKAADDKTLKIDKPKSSKELKNLDIQCTGFASPIDADSSNSGDRVISASISESVKTNSRSTSSLNSSISPAPTSSNKISKSTASLLETEPKIVESSNQTKTDSDLPKAGNKKEKKKAPVKKKEPTKLNADTETTVNKNLAKDANVPTSKKSKENSGKRKASAGPSNKETTNKKVVKPVKPKKTKKDNSNSDKKEEQTDKRSIQTGPESTDKPVKSANKQEKQHEEKDEKHNLDAGDSSVEIDTIAATINEVIKQFKDSDGSDWEEPKMNPNFKPVKLSASIPEPLSATKLTPITVKEPVLSKKTSKVSAGKVTKTSKKNEGSEKMLKTIKNIITKEDQFKDIIDKATIASKPIAKVPLKKKAIALKKKDKEEMAKDGKELPDARNKQKVDENKSKSEATNKLNAAVNVINEAESKIAGKAKTPAKKTLKSKPSDGSQEIESQPNTTKKRDNVKPVGKTTETFSKKLSKNDKSIIKNNEVLAAKVKADQSKQSECSKAEEEHQSDDDISLKCLKTTLDRAKKADTNKAESVNDSTKAKCPVKPAPTVMATLIAPVIKRKYIRKGSTSKPSILQKVVTSENARHADKLEAEAKLVINEKLKDSKDIYDFQESGHSSEDANLTYKKNLKKEPPQTSSLASSSIPFKKRQHIAMKKLECQKEKEKQEKLEVKPEEKNTEDVKKEESCNKEDNESGKKKAIVTKNNTKATKQEKKPVESDSVSVSESDTSNSDSSEKVPKRKRYKKRKSSSENVTATNSSDNDDNNEDNDEKDDSNSDTDISIKTCANIKRKTSVKNSQIKTPGFYTGPKRHRMASLNALAKVQCLYENESRTAQELGFVKEPRNQPRERVKPELRVDPEQAEKEEKKENEEKIETEKKEKSKQKVSNETDNIKVEKEDNTTRTLRHVPGLRGEGTLWEMDDSSMEESGSDNDEVIKSVSLISVVFCLFIIYYSLKIKSQLT